jgi:hypothetical protein
MSYGQMSCAHSVEQVTCGSSCTWTLAPIQGSGEEGDEEQRRIRRVAPEQQVRWSAWTGRHQDTVAWSLVGRASGRVAGDGTDFGDRVDDGGRTRVLAFGRVGGVRAGGERTAARVWAVRGADGRACLRWAVGMFGVYGSDCSESDSLSAFLY